MPIVHSDQLRDAASPKMQRKTGVLFFHEDEEGRLLRLDTISFPLPDLNLAPRNILVPPIPHRTVWMTWRQGCGLEEYVRYVERYYQIGGNKVQKKIDLAANKATLVIKSPATWGGVITDSRKAGPRPWRYSVSGSDSRRTSNPYVCRTPRCCVSFLHS